MRPPGADALGLAFLVLAAAGCQVDPVLRSDEAARFETEVGARTEALGLDAGRTLTLAECEAIALRNNLSYRTRLLASRLQDEQVRAAFAAVLPHAQARFRVSHRSNEPEVQGNAGNVFAFEDQDQRRFTITTLIPIFDFGATWAAYQITEDRRQQDRITTVRARQTLLRDVRTAYARLGGAIRSEALQGAELDAAREALRTARALEREGLAAGADTAALEAALAEAELDLALARRDVTSLRAALSATLSVPAWTAYGIDSALPDLPPPPAGVAAVRALEQAALHARPELWIQDLERHVAAARVRQETARFFPALGGNLDFEWSSNSLQVHPSFLTAGVTVVHSLLEGSETLWRRRAAEVAAEAESERSLLVAMGVIFEVDFRILELVRAHDSLGARERLVEARQALLRQVESRHREGLESGSEVARALASFHAARRALDRTRTEALVAHHELSAAVAAGDLPPPEADAGSAGAAAPEPPPGAPGETKGERVSPEEERR